MKLEITDIEKMAQAIEADAGEPIQGLRESLEQAKAGIAGRVTTPKQILVRAARAKTGLTQQEFADKIATPVATLRDWEQGRFEPPGGVQCLLKLLSAHPELTRELEAA